MSQNPPGDVTSQTSLQRDRTGTARGGKAPMEVAFFPQEMEKHLEEGILKQKSFF